jgi:hypothetical protein
MLAAPARPPPAARAHASRVVGAPRASAYVRTGFNLHGNTSLAPHGCAAPARAARAGGRLKRNGRGGASSRRRLASEAGDKLR